MKRMISSILEENAGVNLTADYLFRANRLLARRQGRLKSEQALFALQPAGVTGRLAAFADDAMAGNNPANWVLGGEF